MSHSGDYSLKTRLKQVSESGKLLTSRHGSDTSDTADTNPADKIVCCCGGCWGGPGRWGVGWIGDFGSVSQPVSEWRCTM